jgi:hypothetical protein
VQEKKAMSDLMRPHCAQCVFWVADDPVTTGHCHRYPPAVYFNERANVAAQKFPTVDHRHWCGEWRDDDAWLKDLAKRSFQRGAGNA